VRPEEQQPRLVEREPEHGVAHARWPGIAAIGRVDVAVSRQISVDRVHRVGLELDRRLAARVVARRQLGRPRLARRDEPQHPDRAPHPSIVRPARAAAAVLTPSSLTPGSGTPSP
jgi:hypothetical protein